MPRALVSMVLVCALVPSAVAKGLPFPKGFRWGTAISGFQSDMGVGAPNDEGTDWWVWTHDPANVASGSVSGAFPEQGPGFWTLYKRDAKLAARQLHANAFRMGIEWSRIFPMPTTAIDASGGITASVLAALDAVADQDAVAHYRAVFAALRKRGLEPLVTLNHFSLPLWLHDPIEVRDAFAPPYDPLAGPVPTGIAHGGWLDPAIVDEFAKYAAYCAWKFGDQVDLWTTLNEPVVVVVSGFVNAPGVGGNFPPGVFSFAAVLATIPNLVAAHARGYDAIHQWDTADADRDGVAAEVGVVHNMVAFHPHDPSSQRDVDGAAHADYLYNRVYPTAVVTGAFDANLDGDTDDPGETRPDLARADFLGVNYYLRAMATGLGGSVTPLVPLFDFIPTIAYATPHDPSGPPCPSTCTDFGWEIYPQGLREVLAWAGTLGVPIYVTENGLADAADTLRARYLYDHLRVLQGVSADGVADVRGYFHWSLTDNYEWSSGYYPKFGAFAFDPATGKRTFRKGARPLAAAAKANAITPKLTKKYGGG